DRQAERIAAALNDVLGDPLELLEQVLAVGHDDRAWSQGDRAEPLKVAPRGDTRRARGGGQPPGQDKPPRRRHAAGTGVDWLASIGTMKHTLHATYVASAAGWRLRSTHGRALHHSRAHPRRPDRDRVGDPAVRRSSGEFRIRASDA